MKKRIFSVLLMLVLVVCLLPVLSIDANAAAEPAFTVQPVGGEVIYGEKLTVSWKLNFTPTKQVVGWKEQGKETVHTLTTLDASATSEKLSGLSSGRQYVVLAYYNEGGVEKKVASDLFQVTNVAPYTAESVFRVDATVAVDTERLADASDAWGEAYLNEEITYQWYRNGAVISGETKEEYEIKDADVGCELYAKVTRSGASLNTSKITIYDVFVGGVGMADDDYLAVGATETTTTKPTGGYAYYKDGKLTLNNYSYKGAGYRYYASTFIPENVYYAVVFSTRNLEVELVGNNKLEQTRSESVAINAKDSTLTIGGDGSCTAISTAFCLGADEKVTINSGTIDAHSETFVGIFSRNGGVVINGGDITASGGANGIKSGVSSVQVNGGKVTAIGDEQAVAKKLSVANDLTCYASAAKDGSLNEYVATQLSAYKKIVIRKSDVFVGGVGMVDGEYLAVGAFVPGTTQPATGGYAYYKDGKLTLHNYTYSGKGYKYVASSPYNEYAFIHSKVDCTIVLEGSNALIWDAAYVQLDRGRGIVPLGNLTIEAASEDASLSMVVGEKGILSSQPVTIKGGNIAIDATDNGNGYHYGIHIESGGNLTIQDANLCIMSNMEAIKGENGSIVIRNSTLDLQTNEDECIISEGDITFEDVNMEIQSTQDCILTTGTVTVSGSSFVSVRSTATSGDSNYSAFDVGSLVVDSALKIQASTDAFSKLGTYAEANRSSYDWVVISEAGVTSPEIFVGNVGMAEGQYLAVGATVPTAAEPTGGYAHYASGVLTLHDYTYSGIGFAYDSDTFTAVLYEGDLTVKLEGTNVLDCQAGGGEYDEGTGIFSLGNLILDAAENASLSITGAIHNSYVDGAGLWAGGSLTVKDGAYTMNAGNGIVAGADVVIEDGSFDITVTDSGVGLYGDQNITIKDGRFTIDGGYIGVFAYNQLVIENGVLSLNTDGDGLSANNGSVTVKQGVLKIQCLDSGIYGETGVTIQDGSIAIQSMNQGITTDSSRSVAISGGDLWITAVYEGIYANETTVTGGNLSVKSTDESNDSAWGAIDGALTVGSGLPIQASTEPDGGLGAYEAAAHDSYDWIVIGTIDDTPMVYAVYLYTNPSDTGTVTGGGMHEAGTDVTVTAVPGEHYDFLNWTEGGVVVSTNASYTFNVAANRDLTANFQPKNYTATVNASPAGAGAVSGGGTYKYNTYITIAATANPGYHFVKWTKDGMDFSTDATKSFSLGGNCVLVAVFEADAPIPVPTYNVTASASPAEGGTVTGAGTYDESTSVTVTAAANPGYHFVKWTEGGSEVSTDAAYIFTLTANRNLVAVFEADPIPTYNVTASASPAEGGTVTGAGTYDEGNSVTVTAAANTGYHFVKWTEGGSEVSTNASYTFAIAANRNLVAVFEADAPTPTPPVDPTPTPTTPVDPTPTPTTPVDPTPTPTTPVDPTPTPTTPVDPTPTPTTPVDPTPTPTTPVDPTPTPTTPVDPTPTPTTPVDPKPTPTTPVDPNPTPTPPTPIKNPFVDVAEKDYFYDAVLWAVQEGITGGIDATHFAPNNPCTRGQVVTFLWRASGSPEPQSSYNPFSDIREGQYYYKAVLWAVEKGITTGLTSTTFAPNNSCTRGQIATFLWRANGSPEPQSSHNPFSDVNGGPFYKAILWAVEKGITTGYSNGTFRPNNVCTRGNIVTFLYRAENQ